MTVGQVHEGVRRLGEGIPPFDQRTQGAVLGEVGQEFQVGTGRGPSS
ncbi:hypothetical protein OHQ90_39205 [Nocardia sp. NBC_00403]